jgi:hypothetical protein
MSSSIVNYLQNKGLNNWQVYGYKWVANAWTLLPGNALVNAQLGEGILLGNSLSAQGWTHIHFIAHSAGAGLIQAASWLVHLNSPGTTVQCTFLDPYDGYDFTGVTSYGEWANWSDSYVAQGDIENAFAPFTDIPLEHAYNVDVTDLDPSAMLSPLFIGQQGSAVCSVQSSSHGWPVSFYQNTIDGNISSDGFGFPLSVEGGNWQWAVAHYPAGTTSVTNLGPSIVACTPGLGVTAPRPVKTIGFPESQTAWQSTTGVIAQNGGGLTIATGSPAWIGILAPYTDAVNVVSFDLAFNSTPGAAGLLSVYWDANSIGSVDEKVVGQGLLHYSLPFPVAPAFTSHVLGFRLDAFTNLQSFVMVTNIALSEAGVSEPFSLLVTTNNGNGQMMLQLSGQPGFDYGLQASTDLVNWTQIAVLENTNGKVNFYDPESTNYTKRFYRALAPY